MGLQRVGHDWATELNPPPPHPILLRFTDSAFFFFLNKLKVYSDPAWNKSVSTIFPTAFAYFVSLCHTLVNSCNISNFSHYYFLLSLINHLWCYYHNCLGHQKPCSCKTVNLVLCILVAPLTILISLFLLRSPHSLRHNNIETRPVNKPTMASKCSSERKSQSINSASFTVILRTATTTPAFSSQPPWSNWGKTVNTEARHSTSRKAATCWMIMVITY